MSAGSGPRRVGVVASVVAVLAVVGVSALLAVGANGPPDPHLEDGGVAGFASVAFRVTPGPGRLPSSGEFCALLADDQAARARGMMGRRDLAGHDAMVFRFPEDVTVAFFMRDVPIPLSIAWFDAGGRFVSSAEMPPCPDRDGCPTYAADRPFRLALEVPAGGLERLGIGEGSVLALGGACSR